MTVSYFFRGLNVLHVTSRKLDAGLLHVESGGYMLFHTFSEYIRATLS